MRIYIICSVRGASDEYRHNLENYVDKLEKEGHVVHLPHRDTNQNASGYEICKQNARATSWADEIHIFYTSSSQGTHFDLGMAFITNKIIKVIDNEKYGEGKSFPRMLDEWEEDQKKLKKASVL